MELGEAEDANNSPFWTQGDPLKVNEIWGIEKSSRIGPSERSHARPKITSGPVTGDIKRGTWKVFLLSSSGVLGRRLLHSINCPLPTMTMNGVIGVELVVKWATMRDWMMLWVLPQSTRVITG